MVAATILFSIRALAYILIGTSLFFTRKSYGGSVTEYERYGISEALSEVFQVYTPIKDQASYDSTIHARGGVEQTPIQSSTRAGNGDSKCKLVLMEHVFAWSYGKPFVGSHPFRY